MVPDDISRQDLEYIVKFCFNELNTNVLYISSSSLMTCFSCGLVNGISILVNHSSVQICPVVEATSQTHLSERLELEEKDSLRPLDRFFNPKVTLSVPELLLNILGNCDIENRKTLADNIVISGDEIDNIFLETFSREFEKLICNSLFQNEGQVKSFQLKTLPEYLSMKDCSKWASWIGGNISSQIIFNDVKNCLTKFEFEQGGLSIVLNKFL